MIWDIGRVEELVIHFIRDEWHGKAAEILLEARGDGVDVQVRIREVKVIGCSLEPILDYLDL